MPVEFCNIMISKEAQKRKKLIFQIMRLVVFINPAKLSLFQIKLIRYLIFIFSFRRPKIKDVSWAKVSLKKLTLYKILPVKIIDKKMILFFHGGGFFLGNFGIYRNYVALLAKLTQREIYYVEYRLGPEFRFPCQLKDALTAYKYLLKERVKAQSVVLAGDSAGGNLALTLFLKIKKENLPRPNGIFVISPWTNPNLPTSEYSDDLCEKDALIGPFIKRAKEKNSYPLSKYFVDDSSKENPFISPLYGDFTEAPPVNIQYSEDEVLSTQIKVFIKQLKKFNVLVVAKAWKGMWHDFQLETDLPETRKSFLGFKSFLDKNIV